VCRDSSVRIATRYGLHGSGIESRWGGGEIFPTSPHWPKEPSGLVYSAYRVCFPVAKRPGHGVDNPPAGIRVELYLCPLWALVACSRVNVTFTSTFAEKFLVGSKAVCLIFTLSQFYQLWRCRYRDRIKRSPDDRK
jgi:hypothetical protein